MTSRLQSIYKSELRFGTPFLGCSKQDKVFQNALQCLKRMHKHDVATLLRNDSWGLLKQLWAPIYLKLAFTPKGFFVTKKKRLSLISLKWSDSSLIVLGSLAIRGGLSSDKFQTSNTRTGFFGLNKANLG